MKQFYITTPIYYVNDKPHLGTAYCTIMCDVLARYHRLFGDSTLFLTGTDEHGQKVQQAAEKRGLSPQEHCDELAENFKQAWKDLNVEYDIFFRTTDDFHKKAVQTALQKLFDQDLIYPDTYEGWYSVSEEIFYTEKDLVDGKSPTGKEVQKITEKNYFFKMSQYQQRLIDYIQNNPEFIQPEYRKNEILGFLKQPLGDLCISRPKSRLSWGVELPFDKDYVTYVWFDALLNYATGVGYLQSDRKSEFEKWWAGSSAQVTHVLGKDILTTHAVYWPTMLMALEVPLPNVIFGHGWILNKENSKMSKSSGDVVNPLEIKNIIGVDGLRYYLTRDIHFGNDAPFSFEGVIQKVNNDLANNIGNLLSRTSNLIGKYFDGKAPGMNNDELSNSLRQTAEKCCTEVQSKIEELEPSYALEAVIRLLNDCNKFLEDTAPWKMAKEDVKGAGEILHVALEILRISGILLQPVMPEKMKELLDRLNVEKRDFAAAKVWRGITPGTEIVKGDPLFPRVELPKATD